MGTTKLTTAIDSVVGAMSTNCSPAKMTEIKSEIGNIKPCLVEIMEFLKQQNYINMQFMDICSESELIILIGFTYIIKMLLNLIVVTHYLSATTSSVFGMCYRG